MNIDFNNVKSIIIPEGEVKQIINGDGDILWNKNEEIDNISPTAIVTFSNNNGASLTRDNVIVTLVADEPIKDIDSWNRVDDRTFTKEYTANGKYKVIIEDLSGNTTTISYEVKRIDRTAPNITIKTGETETIGNNDDGYSVISFKLSDDNALKEYELNGTVVKIANSKWGDVNNVTKNTNSAIVGINTLIVRDTVGNEKQITFKLI